MPFDFETPYIVKSIAGFFTVQDGEDLRTCKARGLFRKDGQTPLAGDHVELQREEEGDTFVITRILTRKNELLRPPVANIDNLFIVVSTVEPSPSLQISDQLCAIAVDREITPLILLTKEDLAFDQEVRRHYSQSGIEVLSCGISAGERCLETLKEKIAGNLSVFTGNSGVGKTTLLNRLLPEARQETAPISEKLGRGRHTTRAVELFSFASGLLADTPGFAALDFERAGAIMPENLGRAFAEFRPYIPQCKFAECSHRKEKGCAVRAAVEAGEIGQGRYENYVALYDMAQEVKPWQNAKPESRRKTRKSREDTGAQEEEI